LHYQVVEHIKETYPDSILHSGLAEHLTTKHAGLDAQPKGHCKGEPDITITWGLSTGFQSVLAIELKNPNGKGQLLDHQQEYHNTMKKRVNVDTIVGNRLGNIAIAIHKHYEEVVKKAKQMTLPAQQPDYDFSTNNKPKYWCNKLKNKTNLMIECKKRGYEDMTYQLMTDCEMAKALIEHDSGKDKLVIEM